ncbi:hypothetical protein [Rhodococcus sp. B50]|uniref:hypothetical protein n=1 Tax=Rhodococcus sp. B50 TaxID=2682847 RepID=UPI001A09E7A3|nr:hypothetical protein [Rhodococcus sp. B50]
MVAVAARAFEAHPGLFLAPHFQPHGLAAVRAGTGVGDRPPAMTAKKISWRGWCATTG